MQSKISAFAITAALALILQGCGGEALSEDPEIADKQIDEKVDAKADTLEEAAAKAVEIRNVEIEADMRRKLDVESNGEDVVRAF